MRGIFRVTAGGGDIHTLKRKGASKRRKMDEDQNGKEKKQLDEPFLRGQWGRVLRQVSESKLFWSCSIDLFEMSPMNPVTGGTGFSSN